MNIQDHNISINKYCPCTQSQCPIRGNCVLCIQNNLDNQNHIPECIQNLVRPFVESLAKQVELKTSDSRQVAKFWEEFDCEDFLKRSLEKHK